MKLLFIYISVGGFAAVGIVALYEGNMRVGVATICLAVANGLLLL